MKKERMYILEKVASMYYLENISQQEIANKLGLTRTNVSRMLTQARQNNLVEIKINYSSSSQQEYSLGKSLEETFSLQEAIVVENLSTETETKEKVASSAAEYFDMRIGNKDFVGITAGTTLELMAEKLKTKKKELSVITMIGSVGFEYAGYLSHEIARKINENIGGKSHILTVPAVVSSEEVMEQMTCEKGIKNIIGLFRKVKTAFFGIGSTQSEHPVYKMISDDEMKKIREQAVGNIGTLFYDKEGNILFEEITERSIGIKKDDMFKIPYRVGVACGSSKTDAIFGAINSKLINVLITDRDSAEKILNITK